MDKNKIIITVLIVIIAALLIGIVAMMPNLSKQDTKLIFKGNSTFTQGDTLKIKLTYINGAALENQTVNITLKDKNNQKSYSSVVTNENGTGKLKLDENSGEYTITLKYDGNDKYNPSNATKKITIEEKVVEAAPSSSSSTQSSGSSTHTVMGEDGYYYVVDDNGNFLQNLGPSQKYYPNKPNSVNYPNAEPAWNYVDKSK